MFNDRVMSIIRREVKSKMASKAFIWGTLSLPLIMALIMGFNYMMMAYEGDSGTKITVIANSEDMINRLENEFNQKDFIKDTTYVIDYKQIDASNFDTEFAKYKKAVLEEKINAIVYIPDSSFNTKSVIMYSTGAKNISMEDRLAGTINTVFVGKYFEDKNVSSDDIKYARKSVDFSNLKITEKEDLEEANAGQLVLAYIFAFMLYMSLLIMGTQMMQSVIEEKQNRIVEVLLSSMKAKEFMTGKIFGSVITGVFQMAIWLSPIVVILGFSLPVLPPELIIKMEIMHVIYFLINFAMGMIVFLSLFGTVGSIFESPQDAQSGVTPLMMLIIIPFFVSFSLIKNPSNPIGLICSFLPFTNIIVMPVRMTLVDLPIYELLGALVVNILTIYFIFPIAGKIYQVGILATGKKPSWKEVFSWLKIKY